jgi:hypothetical protein
VVLHSWIVAAFCCHLNQSEKWQLTIEIPAFQVVEVERRDQAISMQTEHSEMLSQLFQTIVFYLHYFTLELHVRIGSCHFLSHFCWDETAVYVDWFEFLGQITQTVNFFKILVVIQKHTNIFLVTVFSRCPLKIQPLPFARIHYLDQRLSWMIQHWGGKTFDKIYSFPFIEFLHR